MTVSYRLYKASALHPTQFISNEQDRARIYLACVSKVAVPV